MSRLLEAPEVKLEEPELWVKAALWAVRKVKWYCAYAPVSIVVPDKALLACFRARDSHPRCRAWLFELQMYRVELEAGTNAWAFHGALLKGSELQAPIEYEDLEEAAFPSAIRKPKGAMVPAVLQGPSALVYFDGGFRAGTGSTGAVLYDAGGQQVERVGLYYADDIISNNEAEVMALQEALTLALQNTECWGCS